MPTTRSMRARNSRAPSDSPAANLLAEGQHFIEVPDPDFHDFDSFRAAEDITTGQIWAMYDDKDGMPRYYGRIRSVSRSPFKVEFSWLVCERASKESKLWTSRTGYQNATGKFENGEHSTTKIVNIFSHRMDHIKEQFIRGAPTRIIVHPRKGDVWAMYRDWDQVRAITSTESPAVECKFDMVEILVDYTKENGVKTVKLEKVPGFKTVFHRQNGPQAIQVWGTSGLVRFSHNVPMAPMAPNKLISAPKKAMELDPAAVPSGYSTDLENGSGHTERDTEIRLPTVAESTEMEEKLKDGKGTSPCPSSEGQRKPITDIVVNPAALFPGSVESLSPNTDIPFTALEVFESHFYDFNSLRTETDIEAGQIWAIYDTTDRMPRNYVRVVRVLESPFKVDVWRLNLKPPSENTKSLMECAGHSITRGAFQNDKRYMMGLECFSHLVLDRANDCVFIYPRKGEVWAVDRNWDLENGRRKVQSLGLGTPHTSGYDLVEIFSDFPKEGSLELVRLDKVTGFRSLFQRQRKPLVFEKPLLRPEFFNAFSHSIASRKMYRDDKLRIPFGALEVDPACITF